MKIEFTKEQFETLLKTTYLGNWLANAYDDDSENNEFSDLQSYLCGFAGDFGLEELVEHNQQTGSFYPSAAFQEDDQLNDLIERYDDNAFLDKLIYNLAGRDMLSKYGEKKIQAMTDEEFFKEEGSFVQKYQQEFAKNGIQNLMVKMEQPEKSKAARSKG
ncbi:MAG: hypothetical protein H6Q52_475 [Deltaproteobacteria bacterium]|nr:hypothetical protein [Deltaproteobacteria bacterium]